MDKHIPLAKMTRYNLPNNAARYWSNQGFMGQNIEALRVCQIIVTAKKGNCHGGVQKEKISVK